MKNNYRLTPEEVAQFQEAIAGTTVLSQDRILHRHQKKKRLTIRTRDLLQEEDNGVYYFSDEFQPLLASEGPTRYARADVFRDEIKKLRRGDYTPDLLLEVHGLTQLQTKRELAALIVSCRREHIHCARIMHGYGRHILKQQIPLWLAQHPDVLAFHQADQKWGGAAALLVLIELEA